MANKVGQQIGNYRLLKLLGTGGFAEVYLGEHIYLNTHAAIKILQAVGPVEQTFFLKEAKIIASLTHPNIVKLLDYTVENGVPMIVMELAIHGSLRNRHQRGQLVQIETIIAYLKQIAPALDYAHASGLIHRDIKPDNMLVNASGQILVSDFGIAATMHMNAHSMQTGRQYAGTPYYSAPEQLQGNPCAASDQYALAVVVYEWLSGKVPFTGTFTEIAMKHIQEQPVPLHQLTTGIDKGVSDVVMKALEKDPKQRFGSIKDFTTGLEEAIEKVKQTSVQRLTVNAPTQKEVPIVKPYTSLSPYGQYQQFAWSPDGRYIAVLNQTIWNKNGLQVFDAFTMRYIGKVTHERIFGRFVWSPDSTRIAVLNGRGAIYSADIVTGKDIIKYSQEPDTHSSYRWSSDGKWVMIANNENIKMYDALTGKLAFVYKGTDPETNEQRNYYSYSPDLSKIAIERNGIIQVISISNGDILLTYDKHYHKRMLSLQIAWSPDSTRIALVTQRLTTNKHSLHVWDVLTGHTFFTHSGSIDYTVWSPDSTRLAFRDSVNIRTGRADSIQVIDANTGNAICMIQEDHRYFWSPDSRLLATSSSKGINIWDADSGHLQYICQSDNNIEDADWSLDGRIAGLQKGYSKDYHSSALLIWKFS